MNLKNIRILCSIGRQIKVKQGGGEAYLDGQGLTSRWRWSPATPLCGSGSPRGDLTQRSPHRSVIHASKHAEQLSPGSGHQRHYSHYDTLQSINGGNYEGETLQQADVLDLMPNLMVQVKHIRACSSIYAVSLSFCVRQIVGKNCFILKNLDS